MRGAGELRTFTTVFLFPRSPSVVPLPAPRPYNKSKRFPVKAPNHDFTSPDSQQGGALPCRAPPLGKSSTGQFSNSPLSERLRFSAGALPRTPFRGAASGLCQRGESPLESRDFFAHKSLKSLLIESNLATKDFSQIVYAGHHAILPLVLYLFFRKIASPVYNFF